MSFRVANVVKETISPRKKRRKIVACPAGTEFVQVVFDRQLFENITTKDAPLFWVRLYVGKQYMGGAEFAGGRIDTNNPNAVRPGQRMLWSFGRWPIPEGVQSVTIEIEAHKPFSCALDVDFF